MPRKYRYKLIDYGIDDARQDELRAICKQYPSLKTHCDYLSEAFYDLEAAPINPMPRSMQISDPTAKKALRATVGIERIIAIERSAEEAALDMAKYVIQAMCYGKTYEELAAEASIPCGRATFSQMKRLFLIKLDERFLRS